MHEKIKPVIVGIDPAEEGSERTVTFYPAAAYEALQKELEETRNHQRPFHWREQNDRLKAENEAQAKQIEQQLEAIEATADFAKEFWKKADTDSRTRIMVQTFKNLEEKLRTYLLASKNGE